MQEILAPYVAAVVAVFLASAMFSLGLDLSLRQIAGSLRNRRLLVLALAGNVLVVPTVGFLLFRAIPMDDAARIGLTLYALAAGSEAGPKFVQLASGNTAFAVGLLAVLMPITVVVLPAAIGLVVPDAHFDQGTLLLKLAVVVALPMFVGLLIKARREHLAERLSPLAHRLSVLLLCATLVLVVYVNVEAIMAMHGNAFIAGLLFFALAFGVSYLLGGPGKQDRRTLGIMSFARNGTITMMVSSQVFGDQPAVLVTATAMTAMSPVIGATLAFWFRRSG
jgi:BASS family bile acid:Na+ symporter